MRRHLSHSFTLIALVGLLGAVMVTQASVASTAPPPAGSIDTLAGGGTLTGEHGIGLEKLHALGRQYGEPELDAMRRVKAVLDPAGILNPGKTLPEAGADARRGVYADVA